MKRFALLLLSFTLGFLLRGALTPEPQPLHCYLCGSPPYDDPCLVNLSTGQITELRVRAEGEVAELVSQKSGVTVASAAGSCTAAVPAGGGGLDRERYCGCCLPLLRPGTEAGFVLADLSDPGRPLVYPLQWGGSHLICGYTVRVDGEGSDTRISVE